MRIGKQLQQFLKKNRDDTGLYANVIRAPNLVITSRTLLSTQGQIRFSLDTVHTSLGQLD